MYSSSGGRFERIIFLVALSVCLLAIVLNFTTSPGFEIFNSMKPITLVQYSSFVSFALLLEILRFKLRIRAEYRALTLVLVFLCVMATLFEMLWSFGYWFSTYELKVMGGATENSETLDEASYQPSQQLRNYYFYQSMSLNQSAKKNTLFFFMSIYLLWYALREDKIIPLFIDY